VSRLGDIRDQNDANCTYDGENNVLIQQASNWLLNQWDKVIKKQSVSSPLNSADFLMNAEQILNTKFNQTTVEDVLKPESMIQILYCTKIYYVLQVINSNVL
jgi:acyl-CoA oxidase